MLTKRHGFSPDLIFDIGMHNGDDTAYYLAKGFRVVAVDANPAQTAAGEIRFSDAIAEGSLTILNVDIGATAGTFTFYINGQHSEWSSFDPGLGSRGSLQSSIEVPMIPLAELIVEYGMPYYLKIDIEGQDLPALMSGLDSTTKRPRYVSLENGQDPQINYLAKAGYSKFKWVNQATVAKVTLPHPPNEGHSTSWTFPFGSSGPFGNDIIGPWLNETEVRRRSREYWQNPDRDASVDGWFDIHAAL